MVRSGIGSSQIHCILIVVGEVKLGVGLLQSGRRSIKRLCTGQESALDGSIAHKVAPRKICSYRDIVNQQGHASLGWVTQATESGCPMYPATAVG